ncbi:hypothetical protein CHS0354_011127, partial [Potamilus streckersoni]
KIDKVTNLVNLSKSIDSLPNEKTPCSDSIQPKAIKRGKSTLLQPLHELLCP